MSLINLPNIFYLSQYICITSACNQYKIIKIVYIVSFFIVFEIRCVLYS